MTDRASVAAHVREEFAADAPKVQVQVNDLLAKLSGEDETRASVDRTHKALLAVSSRYRDIMEQILRVLNLTPPSAAMAGVFAWIDREVGVWRSPANTSIAAVTSPVVDINNDEQEDLNLPVDGKAVNTIQLFFGRGVLVWGARTLDGNSQDYRYISVRRTLIVLEQSIELALQSFACSPNNAETWKAAQTMNEAFLNDQWKSGALVGATPEDPCRVEIGLGTTMTVADIQEGHMNVTVRLALTHPHEFISISVGVLLQTSKRVPTRDLIHLFESEPLSQDRVIRRSDPR